MRRVPTLWQERKQWLIDTGARPGKPSWVGPGAGRSMPPGWQARRNRHLKAEPNCRVCGSRAVTVDHILARAFGGGEEEINLQSLCARHAKEKDAKDSAIGKRRRKRLR